MFTSSAGFVLLKHSRGIALAMAKTSVRLVSVGILEPKFFAMSLDKAVPLKALAMLMLSAAVKFFRAVGFNKPIWSLKNITIINEFKT